jgi:hypothetical protein
MKLMWFWVLIAVLAISTCIGSCDSQPVIVHSIDGSWNQPTEQDIWLNSTLLFLGMSYEEFMNSSLKING